MTIDAYIEAQPEAVRADLLAVRKTISEALPDAEERISWQMPTYWRGRNLIHFAAARKHVGIYPGPGAVEAFQEELSEKGISSSKGSIRFPYGKADLDLIRRIALWCGEHPGL